MDWREELKSALQGKLPAPEFSPQNPEWSEAAATLFKPVLTESMQQQIKAWNKQDPILAQFLPAEEETNLSAGFHEDPVGDDQATQHPGVIHKYHGRVLLIASGLCAVNCRYCFRRHFPYANSHANQNHWKNAIDYISSDPSIHEVILSGGDPLTLSDKALKSLSNQLQQIDHLKTIRIHSRIPVVLPSRISAAFLSWAESLHCNKVMVLHINHAQELGEEALQSIQALHDAGFMLLNQSVLLKGINDQIDLLCELSEALIKHRISPYYLHQMDRVQNAGHFEVPEAAALGLHQAMRERLPGYMVPRLVQEIPGKASKIPLFD